MQQTIRPPDPDRALEGLKIVVVGGSISGLITAAGLTKYGADVVLLERSKGRGHPRGGALMLRPEAREILTQYRVGLKPGVLINRRLQFVDNNLVARRAPNSESQTWADLYQALLETVLQNGATYFEGHEAIDICPSDTNPSVKTVNGKTFTGNLIVVADGTGSPTMRRLDPALADYPQYAGYVAWRGQLPMTSLPFHLQCNFAGTLREYIDTKNGVFASFPVLTKSPGNQPSISSQELSWTLFTKEEENDLPKWMGRFAKSGLLPPGYASQKMIDHVRGRAKAFLSPDLAGIVCSDENLYFARAVHALPGEQLPTKFHFPGVAVVGDAAGAIRPFTARSSTVAAQSGNELLQALQFHALSSSTLDKATIVKSALEQYATTGGDLIRFHIARSRLIDEAIGLPIDYVSPSRFEHGVLPDNTWCPNP